MEKVSVELDDVDDSTHPRIIEERRDHEPDENHAQAVQQNQQKHWKVVGVLKDSQREKQHNRHQRQERHEQPVDDEPRQPKHRVAQAHDLQAFLDVLLLLAHNENQQICDELRQRHHHVDGNDETEGDQPVAGVSFLREHLQVDVGNAKADCVRRELKVSKVDHQNYN